MWIVAGRGFRVDLQIVHSGNIAPDFSDRVQVDLTAVKSIRGDQLTERGIKKT